MEYYWIPLPGWRFHALLTRAFPSLAPSHPWTPPSSPVPRPVLARPRPALVFKRSSSSISTWSMSKRAKEKSTNKCQKARRLHELFQQVCANFCLLPCDTGKARLPRSRGSWAFSGCVCEGVGCALRRLVGNYAPIRNFSGQLPDWNRFWRDFSEVRGGSDGSFRKGA